MLAGLKLFLKEQKIDYFFLPNSDEFFSEYLPESDKRLQYLTGFTGSAASVIVGQGKSYFFTDGRYILQAKNELDLGEFEIFNIAQKSVLVWLDENLGDKKLALDPKLVNLNFVDALAETPVFLEQNPIDAIWQNRPNPSNSEIFVVGEDSQAKRRNILQNLDADALVITKPENTCWLLNIRAADVEFTPLLLAYAILFKNGEVDLFVEKNRARPDLAGVNFFEPKDFAARLSTAKKIQIDPNTTNQWLFELLQKNDAEIILKKDPIELAKACKNSAEISGAIKSHEADGLALTKFLFWLSQKPETDEILAAEKLLELRQENPNFLYPSFASISGFASNGAVIHYKATEKTNRQFSNANPQNRRLSGVETNGRFLPRIFNKLKKESSVGFDSAQPTVKEVGSLYLIDSGGQYFSADFFGTTDVTRTIAIGKPTPEMVENFTRVLKGHIALARAKFPRGTSGAQLDVLAREHLWRAGLDYDHGTGHGVGSFLSVHEGPCGISKRAHQPLLEGMILSNEPGFYKEGEYGIRIENLMLVEKAGDKFLQFKTLTLAPLDLNLINFKMLTRPERKWLADYHAEILEKLSNKLSLEERNWLENVCENKF
ncbi:MAG: aminopeptidase P family protein [Rickettsiales bacterium]|nr:aminopeptidase P family protein [Rickettsiales bacterium]